MDNEEKKPEVTVKDLDNIMAMLAEKEVQKENAEAVVKALNKEIATLEGRAVAFLKETGREKYDSPHGKFKIEQKWRVNLPAGDIEKKAFFEHLRERGIFDKMATVNANSLNALYMKDWAEAKRVDPDAAMTFSMPGIGAPKLFEAGKFSPAKK